MREISTLVSQSSYIESDSKSPMLDGYLVAVDDTGDEAYDEYYYMIKFMNHQITSPRYLEKNLCINEMLDKIAYLKTLEVAQVLEEEMGFLL